MGGEPRSTREPMTATGPRHTVIDVQQPRLEKPEK